MVASKGARPTAGCVAMPNVRLDFRPRRGHYPAMDRRRFMLTSLADAIAAALGAEGDAERTTDQRQWLAPSSILTSYVGEVGR